MRALIGAVAVLAFAGAAAGQDKKDKDGPIDPKKLVGRWETTDPKKQVVVEFAEKDNKATLSATLGGKTETAEGTYKVDGAKVEIELKIGGKADRQTSTILVLTDDELVLKGPDGVEEKFRRTKPKK